MLNKSNIGGEVRSNSRAALDRGDQLDVESAIVIVDLQGLDTPNEDYELEDTESQVRESSPFYESATMETVHRLASNLHEAGVFSKATMRKYDSQCLKALSPIEPQDIKDMREAAGVSQAVLAHILNVTANSVGQWERGVRRPTGAALKLLTLARTKGLSTIV